MSQTLFNLFTWYISLHSSVASVKMDEKMLLHRMLIYTQKVTCNSNKCIQSYTMKNKSVYLTKVICLQFLCFDLTGKCFI
jgi:hypothetical protein